MPPCSNPPYQWKIIFFKARLHGSPRLINTIESIKLNSTVERYSLHGSTKVNEAVDFKMAANELVREGVVVICEYLIKEFLISNFRRVLNIVCILLGISLASDCGLPTFRNPLSVPSSRAGCKVWSILHTLHPALEDGTDSMKYTSYFTSSPWRWDW